MPQSTDKQTLQNGQVFLHFQIEKRLGVGGMGEVYLATDAKLGRKVALKILPAEKMRSSESVVRFEQEARAASSLSHPNIAHIYEIGESDGLRFIAMEYIEGESLARKISGSPLSTAETVKIAIQITDALDEAHEQGIIHRDIKSDNVMLDKRGRVKVLDFGLAKIAHAINSEDATALKTRSGVVMGTASYMSPEQALGRETDVRTDLWSSGVILYEMTTGRLPFIGESITETIDKITHSQPDAIARFNYGVPAELEVIIKKSLRKAPDERYQSARDLLIDLKALSKELDLAERSTAPGFRTDTDGHTERESRTGEQATQTLIRNRTTEEAQAPSVYTTSSAEYIVGEIKRHKLGVAVTALVLVVLAAGGVGIYKMTSQSKDIAPREIKFAPLTSGGKVENETIVGAASISPDGKRVVFWTEDAGKSSCWVRQVSSNSTVRILDRIEGAGDSGTTFSPDGEFVYYSKYDPGNPQATLYQIPVLGGTPRRILDGVNSSITFSPDGKEIAFVRENISDGLTSLMVAPLDGSSESRTIISRKSPESLSTAGPSWSPDGKVIVVGAYSDVDQFGGKVIAVLVNEGTERVLTTSKWTMVGRVVWLSDGQGLVIDALSNPLSTGTQIWYISYPNGVARRITNDLNGYGTSSLGVSSDGNTIATVKEDYSQPIAVIGPNEDPGRERQISNGKYDGRTGIAVTPDGKIVYCSPDGDANNIWIMNADGSGKRQLTNDQFSKAWLAVAPDDSKIVFGSTRSGAINLWRTDIDGNNQKQLTDGPTRDFNPTFSADGKWILFNSVSPGNEAIWKVPIDGGKAEKVLDRVTLAPTVSPDGKFVACFLFDEKEPLTNTIGVFPFEGGDFVKTFRAPDTTLLSAGLVWAPDGQSVTYVDGSTSSGANIVIQPITGGSPKQLTKFKSDRIYTFAWTHDGKQLVYSRGPFVDDVVLIKDFR